MASAIPYDVRKQIIFLRQSGRTYPQISEEVGYSLSGVKKIWYQYQEQGIGCLTTQYENCGRQISYPKEVLDAVATIRTGDQGANYVYSMLKMNYPHLERPSVRTIQYWWKAAGTNRAKGKPSDTEKKQWTKQAHHTWQVDGKELVTLADASQVSWMNVADEGTGAHFKADVHSCKRVSQMDLKQAINSVNQAFGEWGLPECLKIDNGLPFVNPRYRDVPTTAKLWWIGLGIKVIQNPPRLPQENGIVECLQGTCYRWANPSSCNNIQELQKALDQTSDFQRNHYEIPSLNNKTRKELYPQLELNPRKYDPNNFDIEKIYKYLSKKVWQRKAKSIGSISFFGQNIHIGRAFGGVEIYITFDPTEKQWIFRNKKGLLLKTSCKAVPQMKDFKEFTVISKN